MGPARHGIPGADRDAPGRSRSYPHSPSHRSAGPVPHARGKGERAGRCSCIGAMACDQEACPGERPRQASLPAPGPGAADFGRSKPPADRGERTGWLRGQFVLLPHVLSCGAVGSCCRPRPYTGFSCAFFLGGRYGGGGGGVWGGAMTRKPKLGQNFLVDDGAGQAIADSLGPLDGRTVIEIGPGHGAITQILAGRCRPLIAIAIDRALAAELRFRFREQAQVEIVEADVLEVDLEALLRPGETAEVVGNLAYYITSEILLRLLAAGERGQLTRAVLMLQREVADRLAAAPGVRAYGLLSATAQMSARIETLFTLPPTAFSPPPEVFSTVLLLEFVSRFHALGVDPKGFDRFLRSC